VAAKGRIEVHCPHCGNIQSEAELAKSTYCRKCGGYIKLGKAQRSSRPQEIEKQPSVLQKLESFFGVQRTVVAHCFECAGKREVPKSATSTICPQCGAYIDIQDYRIVGNFSRSIRTRGSVIVTNKGDLSSNRVICDSAEIQGKMRGSLVCNGNVHIKLKGKLTGSIQAKSVYIDKKCEAEFVRPIRAEKVEIEGVISARIISTGTVIIQKTGRFTGALFGRGFTVEKGGEFFGELSIGNVELTQGEFLEAPKRLPAPQEKSGSGADFSLAPA
jgi:cytoskeletal protein CcmA (bactofilin family)/Zn finger protein HypA/HybF involved in hydrogenase expression